MAHPLHLDEVAPDSNNQHPRLRPRARCPRVQVPVATDDAVQPKLHATPSRLAHGYAPGGVITSTCAMSGGR